MNRNLKLAVSIVMLCLPVFAGAKTKVKAKKAAPKAHFKLLEAYSQRTLPGVPGGAAPEVANHFVIIWQTTGNLETCFWRGDNGWMTCRIDKAHKINPKDGRHYPPGVDYVMDEMYEGAKKGDTLMLTPVRGGKFAVPAEIPATAYNTIFYKAGGSKWLSFPVKEITKKKDVPMP